MVLGRAINLVVLLKRMRHESRLACSAKIYVYILCQKYAFPLEQWVSIEVCIVWKGIDTKILIDLCAKKG